MKGLKNNKVIFLDRDGVINHDPGDYTTQLADFHILPDVVEALKVWQLKGYQFVVITNQAGIAKGLYTHNDVKEIHDFMCNYFADNGIEITDVFYSPYHENFSKSLTRKPGSLMLEKAIYLYNIDPSQSVMIGDKQRDIDAAKGAGVDGILIETNQSLLDIVDQIK